METNEFDNLMKKALTAEPHEEFNLPPSFTQRTMQLIAKRKEQKKRRETRILYLSWGSVILLLTAFLGYVVWNYFSSTDFLRFFKMYQSFVPILLYSIPVAVILCIFNLILKHFVKRAEEHRNISGYTGMFV